MVSERYQDSSTVSTSASENSPRMRHAHREQALVHLARLAGQQDDADRVVVALHRLGHRDQQPVLAGATDIGRHLAAVVGVGEPQLLLHVGLPVEPGGARGDVHHQRLRRVVRQHRQHPVIDPADRGQQRRRAIAAGGSGSVVTAPPVPSRTRLSATIWPSGA